MHYSENTLFLLWTGENGDEQRVKYFLSISVSGCFFQCGRWAKTHQRVFVSNDSALLWTGINKTKALVWAKLFCFV